TEYKGKVKFAFKDLPLPMHPNAAKAAEAAHCADAQGKYWELHDLMLKNKRLDIAGLKENGRTLQMDTAAFDKCLESGEKAGIVKAHTAEAQALGVHGTPMFFINGRLAAGMASFEQLRALIDEEISIAKKQRAAQAKR